jgi:hypothetical protein
MAYQRYAYQENHQDYDQRDENFHESQLARDTVRPGIERLINLFEDRQPFAAPLRRLYSSFGSGKYESGSPLVTDWS